MKQLFALIFSLIMLLTCSCASAATETTGFTAGEYDPDTHKYVKSWRIGDFRYIILNDDTAEITGYTGSASELVIPAMIGGVQVSSIGAQAFHGNSALCSVTIPEGVTTIGPDAFTWCDHLTRVILPRSVTTIHSGAFSRCYALKSMVIPDSVTTMNGVVYFLCESIILYVTPGSSAEQYAQERDIQYFYSEDVTEAWTCPVCLSYNIGNFCTGCGVAMPRPQSESAPVDDGSWTCTCGAKNTSKFCSDCGTARPAETAPVTDPECSGCGYRPEGDVPRFCPECGTKF